VKQALIVCAPNDNYATYPYLQLGVGLPLLLESVQEYLNGEVRPRAIDGREIARSRLLFHPTLWFYLVGRLRGVK